MKRFSFLLLISLVFPGAPSALDCVWPSFDKSVSQNGVVIHGRVMESRVRKDNEYLKVRVLEVMKGDEKAEKVDLAIRFWRGRAEAPRFPEGSEILFAVSPSDINGVKRNQNGSYEIFKDCDASPVLVSPEGRFFYETFQPHETKEASLDDVRAWAKTPADGN